MSTKRQQTMAKIARERAVREKRELKLEKKAAAAAERKARKEGGLGPQGEESWLYQPGEPSATSVTSEDT
jgi:hypothetical protein